jgi:hypothetical protein
MPCKVSVHCDYKFFVDAAPTTLKKMPELLSESFTYDDMVFRNSCSLMQRHPEYVNYGNAPPVGNNLFRYDKSSSEEENMDKIPNPDYVFRRMYKIDWKVCMCFAFLIFAVFQKKTIVRICAFTCYGTTRCALCSGQLAGAGALNILFSWRTIASSARRTSSTKHRYCITGHSHSHSRSCSLRPPPQLNPFEQGRACMMASMTRLRL